MKYNIYFDQEFAIINGLTLTQVATLSACMSIATWAVNVALNGKVWYRYSETKMAEDYPLLFGVPKRCYKNFSELAEMGFIELTKIGKEKYLTYTDKCKDWNGPKVQNRTNYPETDEKQSENGLNISPKTDAYNNISIYNNNKDNNINGGAVLFSEPEIEVEKKRGTTEPLCLFADSKYFKFEDFAACFTGQEYAGIDICHYWGSVADWSSRKGKKQKDWIATARSFMRIDKDNNKLHMIIKEQPNNDAWARVMQRNIDLGR